MKNIEEKIEKIEQKMARIEESAKWCKWFITVNLAAWLGIVIKFLVIGV